MENYTSIQAVMQNLEDAGCDSQTVEQFMELKKEGKAVEQLNLLSIHRKFLLDRVHAEEKRIDCLDYLVYQIKKENRI